MSDLKGLLYILASFFASTVYGQNALDTLEEKLSLADSVYKRIIDERALALLQASKSESTLFPDLTITPGTTLSLGATSVTSELSLSVPTPWGGILSGSASGVISQESNSLYRGTPSVSFGYSHSLVGPDLGFGIGVSDKIMESYNIPRKVAELNFIQKKRTRISDVIRIISNGLIARSRVEFDKFQCDLIDTQSRLDQDLWEKGNLSLSDLKQNELIRNRSKDEILQRQFDDLENELYFSESGLLTLAPEDLNVWISNLERDAQSYFLSVSLESQIDLLNLQSSYFDSLKTEISASPQLSSSLSLSPNGKIFTATTPQDAIIGMFDPDGWMWSASIQIVIPCLPWDETYLNRQAGSLSRNIFDLRKNELDNRVRREQTLRKGRLELLKRVIIQKKEQLIVEIKRLELTEILFRQGKVTELERDMQKHQIKTAELECLKSRVNLVLYLIAP